MSIEEKTHQHFEAMGLLNQTCKFCSKERGDHFSDLGIHTWPKRILCKDPREEGALEAPDFICQGKFSCRDASAGLGQKWVYIIESRLCGTLSPALTFDNACQAHDQHLFTSASKHFFVTTASGRVLECLCDTEAAAAEWVSKINTAAAAFVSAGAVGMESVSASSESSSTCAVTPAGIASEGAGEQKDRRLPLLQPLPQDPPLTSPSSPMSMPVAATRGCKSLPLEASEVLDPSPFFVDPMTLIASADLVFEGGSIVDAMTVKNLNGELSERGLPPTAAWIREDHEPRSLLSPPPPHAWRVRFTLKYSDSQAGKSPWRDGALTCLRASCAELTPSTTHLRTRGISFINVH